MAKMENDGCSEGHWEVEGERQREEGSGDRGKGTQETDNSCWVGVRGVWLGGEAGGGSQKKKKRNWFQGRKSGRNKSFFCCFFLTSTYPGKNLLSWHFLVQLHPALHRAHLTPAQTTVASSGATAGSRFPQGHLTNDEGEWGRGSS